MKNLNQSTPETARKPWETPRVELIDFSTDDILTASVTGTKAGDDSYGDDRIWKIGNIT